MNFIFARTATKPLGHGTRERPAAVSSDEPGGGATNREARASTRPLEGPRLATPSNTHLNWELYAWQPDQAA